MLRIRFSIIFASLIAGACAQTAAQPGDLTQFVNVFIGTGGHGHTTPAATVPFGMVQLGPDTYNFGWDWCSGYHYSDSSIMGFSHTHLSGTGVSDMLDVLVMPGTGPDRIFPGSREAPGEGYRSRFSHSEESAQPGYYSVMLKDYRIKAELSATARAGIHRYTFPASDSSHFIIDLAHAVLRERGGAPAVLSSELKIVDNQTITGGRRVGNWANGRYVFFALKFSKPFLSSRVVSTDRFLDPSVREAASKSLKALVHYKTTAGEVILVKVGLSGVSVEGALKNLEAEIPDWDFEKVRRAARTAWQAELSKVAIETPSRKNREIFYTALYHALFAPNLFDDVDGRYRGMDGLVHTAPAGLHNYGTFSLWDTYRAAHPLYTLIERRRVPDMANCLIRMAVESPDGLPVWPLAGVETGCMIGYHSVAVIAEAGVKGFDGIDLARLYPRLKDRIMRGEYRGLDYYRKLGYIPCDLESESVSKTLECSYDDWAAAQIAKILGRADDYRSFLALAANYRNVFDKSTGFARPRLASGEWAAPFDPKETTASRKWRDYTEANAWQGSWAAQQDPQGYIELLGGRQAFIRKLDALFSESSELKGEAVPDITGLIGQYAHGNEPSHHIAYLYAYAGAPYKTQERVRDLLERMYHNAPDGLTGNEDCGQMSAWYVMSALGFYAVDPVSGNYVFGSPLFDKATIDMGENRVLVIEARNRPEKNRYVQSVSFNGQPYDRVWFSHRAIARGGHIVFEMGGQPNTRYGAAESAAPPSMSK